MPEDTWINPFGEYGNKVWEEEMDTDNPFYDLMIEDMNDNREED